MSIAALALRITQPEIETTDKLIASIDAFATHVTTGHRARSGGDRGDAMKDAPHRAGVMKDRMAARPSPRARDAPRVPRGPEGTLQGTREPA
ncbi:hypothetical protein [Actinophytocola sp.]|uniref:hypothetical protein n=1 Tax=Actinophytocola sp. TaxID=1872138 RepID=UPI002ED62A8B